MKRFICQNKECGRVFIREKESKYCSIRCSSLCLPKLRKLYPKQTPSLNEITLPFLEQAVNHINSLPNNVRSIMDMVASVFGITPYMLVSPRKKNEIIMARHAMNYIMAQVYSPKYSLKSIAGITKLDSKDHTTIIHSVKTAKNLMDTDPHFKMKMVSCIHEVEMIINKLPRCPKHIALGKQPIISC